MFVILIMSSVSDEENIIGPYTNRNEARDDADHRADKLASELNWDIVDDYTDDNQVTIGPDGNADNDSVSFAVLPLISPHQKFSP